eukprot:scaffold85813_cov33-Phaeocystis_antarctica.AAC.1
MPAPSNPSPSPSPTLTLTLNLNPNSNPNQAAACASSPERPEGLEGPKVGRTAPCLVQEASCRSVGREA